MNLTARDASYSDDVECSLLICDSECQNYASPGSEIAHTCTPPSALTLLSYSQKYKLALVLLILTITENTFETDSNLCQAFAFGITCLASKPDPRKSAVERDAANAPCT